MNGVAVFPKFGAEAGASKQLTDFNDLARLRGDLGREAVKGQLQPVIEKTLARAGEKTREAKVEKTRGQKELVRP